MAQMIPFSKLTYLATRGLMYKKKLLFDAEYIYIILELMKHKVMGLLILMGNTFNFSTVENMTIANLSKNTLYREMLHFFLVSHEIMIGFGLQKRKC